MVGSRRRGSVARPPANNMAAARRCHSDAEWAGLGGVASRAEPMPAAAIAEDFSERCCHLAAKRPSEVASSSASCRRLMSVVLRGWMVGSSKSV